MGIVFGGERAECPPGSIASPTGPKMTLKLVLCPDAVSGFVDQLSEWPQRMFNLNFKGHPYQVKRLYIVVGQPTTHDHLPGSINTAGACMFIEDPIGWELHLYVLSCIMNNRKSCRFVRAGPHASSWRARSRRGTFGALQMEAEKMSIKRWPWRRVSFLFLKSESFLTHTDLTRPLTT